MPFYRNIPLVIEAFRLGEAGKPTPAPEWFPSPKKKDITKKGIIVHNSEGKSLALWGDYIVKHPNGELYALKPDVFRKTYEAA